MQLPRVVMVVVVVPLLLLVAEFSSCAASCPGSVDGRVPPAVKQEAGPPPVGCVAPRRPDALLAHALRLHSAGGEELDVVYREGCRDDTSDGVNVRGHFSEGADDGDEQEVLSRFVCYVGPRRSIQRCGAKMVYPELLCPCCFVPRAIATWRLFVLARRGE